MKKYSEDDYKIDLSSWELKTFDQLRDAFKGVLRNAVTEALTIAMESKDTFVHFPIEWAPDSDGMSGPTPDDPLTVHLTVALGAGDLQDPTYKFNLKEALAHVLQDTATDGSYSEGMTRLSAALRKWADEIDAAIAQSSQARK